MDLYDNITFFFFLGLGSINRLLRVIAVHFIIQKSGLKKGEPSYKLVKLAVLRHSVPANIRAMGGVKIFFMGVDHRIKFCKKEGDIEKSEVFY